MKRNCNLQLVLPLALSGFLIMSCGGKSSQKSASDAPQKNGVGDPIKSATDPSTTAPQGETKAPQPEVKPLVPAPTPPPPASVMPSTPKPVEETKPASTVGITGIWAVALGKGSRSCSSIYDFRDTKALSIHLLCPSDEGKSIALQTENFSRSSDDGKNIVLKRNGSTCPISGTTPGSVFFSYQLTGDPLKQSLQLTEGTRVSPQLIAVSPENFAGDLGSANSLHGRNLIRGCFQSGNLSKFVAGGLR